MIETWLAQKAVRIAILVAALLFPFAAVGCTVETVKLHGISFHLWPFGQIELAHGALADTRAALAARDTALQNLGQARANETTLQSGLGICNASVEGLAKAAAARQAAASAAASAAAARLQHDLGVARAALAKIKSSGETCPVAEEILRAAFND